jgi:hypothetical protein
MFSLQATRKSFKAQPSIFSGLEEFENKVDQIAAGHEENSWISALYKKFSDNFISGNDNISEDQATVL